jgi:hypothetical protein
VAARPERRITDGGAVRYFTPDDPTAVYRLFNSDGDLIYVGIAYDPEARSADHGREQPWWDEVARFDVTWWPNRLTAEVEEKRAIREEVPRYNKARQAIPQKPATSTPPTVGISATGVLFLSRHDGWLKLPRIKSPIGYRNFMGPLLRAFPGWDFPWSDLAGLQVWAESERLHLAGIPGLSTWSLDVGERD